MGSCTVEMKVLIIGAGSAGLLIAQGLKKHGIPFEIFERDASPDARSRDWSFLIHWASENLQACLEPEHFSRLADTQCDPYYRKEVGDFEPFPYKDGETGELLMTIPLAKSYRVTRKKLKAYLSEGLDIHFNKKIATCSTTADGVTAIFEDGSISHGTHIIGADGAKSSMRTLICGAEKAALTPMDIIFCNFRTKYTAEQSQYLKYGEDFHPLINICVHGGHKVALMIVPVDMCDRNDPSTWIWQVFMSMFGRDQEALTKMTRVELVRLLRGMGETFCEPFKSALGWLSDDAIVTADVLMSWNNIAPWDNRGGKVTLAGDAALAMTPFRAQGLNNAIMDAAYLVRTMVDIKNGKSTKEAIDEYEGEMIPRGKKEIEISYEAALRGHEPASIMAGPMAKLKLGKTDTPQS